MGGCGLWVCGVVVGLAIMWMVNHAISVANVVRPIRSHGWCGYTPMPRLRWDESVAPDGACTAWVSMVANEPSVVPSQNAQAYR